LVANYISNTLFRYGKSFNTHDLIKVIALFIMVIDHVGYYLMDDNPWFRMIGRMCAPMLYFLIGYVNKLRINYFLIAYGIILSFTGAYLYHRIWIDILITFIVYQALLHYFPVERISTLWRSIFFLLLLPINFLIYVHVEYGILGIYFLYSSRMAAIKDPQASFWFALTLFVYFIWQLMMFPSFFETSRLYSFAFLTLGVFFILRFYTLKTLPCPKVLLWPLLFISRYSLHIYFYHLIALQALWIFYLHPR
jgi:hypothetical protein